MSRITLRQAAAWCGGRVEPQFEDVAFLGANNDTRKIQTGQLFVALEGVRDGHDFIDAAFEKGASAVLCKRCQGAYPALIVEDPRIALGQIAAGYRQALGMKVVGVTGSVGKSTTKEMIAAVLQGNYHVSKTPANFNNDLGMPMSILAMEEDTQVAVLEMGMNHFGEIRYLTNPTLEKCIVRNHETGAISKIYDMSKLTSRDLYDVFLSGAASVLTIENPNATSDRELIIFRDSFGSSLAPLLVQDYKTVTLVDIRYISSAYLEEVLDFHGQDVLFLYSTLILNSSNSLK